MIFSNVDLLLLLCFMIYICLFGWMISLMLFSKGGVLNKIDMFFNCKRFIVKIILNFVGKKVSLVLFCCFFV